MTNANDSVSSQFAADLQTAIMDYAMLKHPFYVAWTEGRLTQAVLAEYAKQYYAHVRAFPTYVSAVHSRCDDLELRQELLENLIEEERGRENHPELWLRFAEALGVSRSEVKTAELLPSTVDSVARLRSLTQRTDYRQGLAALFAYESQIPEVAQTKRAGLKDYYGIAQERAVSFFRVHESVDLLHQQVELRALEAHCQTPEARRAAIAAAREAAQGLWGFLDGVSAAYLDANPLPAPVGV
jgi:pyrroloquinoline-quinone synthase